MTFIPSISMAMGANITVWLESISSEATKALKAVLSASLEHLKYPNTIATYRKCIGALPERGREREREREIGRERGAGQVQERGRARAPDETLLYTPLPVRPFDCPSVRVPKRRQVSEEGRARENGLAPDRRSISVGRWQRSNGRGGKDGMMPIWTATLLQRTNQRTQRFLGNEGRSVLAMRRRVR